MGVFVIGINQQLKEFFYESDLDYLGTKISVLVICFLLFLLILYKQYQYLNRQKARQRIINFYEICREKILNDSIFESKLRRNFTLIFITFQQVLIPTIFIQFSWSWQSANIISISLEVLFLIILIRLMPFQSKLTNFYFIMDTLSWISLYIQFYLIIHFSSMPNTNNYSTILDRLSLSFVVTIQIIQFLQPFFMKLKIVKKSIATNKQLIQQFIIQEYQNYLQQK
ncbi:transmembrane protein, putative (macronuclear) [Tetrahymena thermophila SB210]|uniref:Transmembrane protein, putative n=1 Tax=Tetrahymena thermophila (strain SB210) TaxID=312017 RepID=W7WWI6_TETTS|nr:transmembrane protein, putative [Tetrahymena thermophila SB210]EWS71195.1 transmembrane protein, putative [Tetrahymena thermophila SB210]|eukprot:XP_012656293.1 transmembrane protein, putative [Tetrahymena thermophila SB210]